MLVAAGLLFIGQHLRAIDPLNVVPPPDYQSVASMRRYYSAVENLYRLQGFEEDPTIDPAKRGEMPGLDYLQAYRAYIEERAFPRDRVDWDAWQRGSVHREKMPAATTVSGRDRHGPRGTWSFVGPRNLDIPYRIYYGQPPLTGRINAIAVDPSNDQVIYVGAASGGVWKTVDGGTSWTPLSDKWPFLHVSCIAIHPDQPNTVYVGTGDFDGSVGYTNGIMKSTDGGATWSQIAISAMDGRACREIVIDPENPQIVTAFFGRGSTYFGRIFRSTNAGASWTNVTPGTNNVFNDATIGASAGGTRIMWATDNNFRRLYKSVNRGATWTEITNVGFQGSGGQVRIAASLVHPETAYILEATASPGRILKTEDAGATWTVVNNNFVNGNGDNYNWSQRGYNAYIECSARQVDGEWQDVLYVGMIDLVQSLDGGQNWRSVGGPAYVWDSVLHNDQHCVAVNPSDWNEIYTGLDGGINRFNLNPTTGDFTWQYLSAELGVTQFYRSAYHPTDTTRMLGGTQDNATPVAVGDLATWQNHGGGDGGWSTPLTPISNTPRHRTWPSIGRPPVGPQETTSAPIGEATDAHSSRPSFWHRRVHTCSTRAPTTFGAMTPVRTPGLPGWEVKSSLQPARSCASPLPLPTRLGSTRVRTMDRYGRLPMRARPGRVSTTRPARCLSPRSSSSASILRTPRTSWSPFPGRVINTSGDAQTPPPPHPSGYR